MRIKLKTRFQFTKMGFSVFIRSFMTVERKYSPKDLGDIM